MYVTPPQLAEMPGALELAQLASPAHGDVVPPALLELVLRGLPPGSGYGPEEIALATEATQRINQVITETDALIDAYIVKRVPVIPVLPVPSILTSIARPIVRYKLHGDRLGNEAEDPVIRDYKVAMRQLEAIRDGKITLGITDPASAAHPGPGDVQFDSDPTVFGRDQMRHFR